MKKKRCKGKKFADMNAAIGLFNTFGKKMAIRWNRKTRYIG
jgi:hypothetical protein